MQPNDWFWVEPLTPSEIELRQALALAELDEELAASWVEHQGWCAAAESEGECSCGSAANVWFSGLTRVVGVGYDRQPHVFAKH